MAITQQHEHLLYWGSPYRSMISVINTKLESIINFQHPNDTNFNVEGCSRAISLPIIHKAVFDRPIDIVEVILGDSFAIIPK